MASKNKIIEIIGATKAVYPYFAKETNVELLVNMWQMTLAYYDDKELETAFLLCLKTCKTPPTPADIIEQINSLQMADAPTDEELWYSFTEYLKESRRYVYSFGYTMTESNGKTQGQNAREKFHKLWESMPEDIKQFVGGEGEMIRIARADDDELKFERSRFFKTIPTIRKRKEIADMRNMIESKNNLSMKQIASTETHLIEKGQNRCSHR